MRCLAAVAVSAFLVSCSNIETRQVGDGTTQRFAMSGSMPAKASNDWAAVLSADLLIGQRADGSGADFWWGVSLQERVDYIQSVTVYDVTTGPPVLLFEDREFSAPGGIWSGETVKRPLNRESLPWLFEPGDSERVLKFRLRNSIDVEKSLYQLVRYNAETNAARAQVASGE